MISAADLESVAEILRRQNSDACHAVAAALEAVASGAADSLDALLLDRGRGKRAVSTLARLQRRNAAIREAAAEFYNHLPTPEEQGRALYGDVLKYSLSTWRTDRRTGNPLASKRHLYRILVECVENDFPGPGRFGQVCRGGSQNE